jgi:hypothetical protein
VRRSYFTNSLRSQPSDSFNLNLPDLINGTTASDEQQAGMIAGFMAAAMTKHTVQRGYLQLSEHGAFFSTDRVAFLHDWGMDLERAHARCLARAGRCGHTQHVPEREEEVVC